MVIILVLERDDQTNLDQALRAAMERESARAPILDALLKEVVYRPSASCVS